MAEIRLRPMESRDYPSVEALWNACVKAGEVLYYPLTEKRFLETFVRHEGCEPGNLLVAETDGRITGMVHGVAPGTFRLSRPGQAYLTCLLVAPEARGQGVGSALLRTLKARMREAGADTLYISSLNPVSLAWRIPGTPGHDHNNMPGLDTDCAGWGFFLHRGFQEKYREAAFYRDLADYRLPEEILIRQDQLLREGIRTGYWQPSWGDQFDGMCDRVGSEYWRDVLSTEITAWKTGQPNADERFWPDGRRPDGPRPLLTAVCQGQIVGFTGPVDRQESGRGWFTGICTDPLFERHGIATVLFNLLMNAFVQEGAAFTTLFTGLTSHARKVYERAGLRPIREFALMALPLNEEEEGRIIK